MYLFSRRYTNDAGKGTLSVCLSGILLLMMAVSTSCAETVLSGRVSKVIDGDSFILKTTKRSYEIRLWGIDCPEYTQPFASQARAISMQYLKGKEIKVHIKYQDRYDRFIGLATRGKMNINQKLVEDGAAWVYKKYCHAPICTKWETLEEKARRSGEGLWHSKNAVAPWEWRKRKQ